MKVYHGSYTTIENIDFAFCRKRRDFGKGFYVTKIRSQAEYWAVRKGEDNDTEGVITEFQFDEVFFEDEDLKALRFDGYSEEWLDFIVLNRKNRNDAPAHDYDLVEGPVADDDIATKIYDYLNGKIMRKDFLKELSFRRTTHQICFCSLKSLQAIDRLENPDFVYNLKNINKSIIMNLVSEKGMDKADAVDKFYNSETFARLADKNTLFYQKDLLKIYELLLNELTIDN
jgi:hypothetical protein